MHLTRNYQENCVMARIMRQTKMHQKNFSLKQYGSWKAAERAGQAWVKEQLQVLPPKAMNAKGRMSTRNHSGVVGVFLSRSVIRKKSGKEYEYWWWVARWPNCKFKGGLG